MGNNVQNSSIDKSLEGIIVKADDIASLAKIERADADGHQESANKQHVAAHKLEDLSEALRDEVAKIKAESIVKKPNGL